MGVEEVVFGVGVDVKVPRWGNVDVLCRREEEGSAVEGGLASVHLHISTLRNQMLRSHSLTQP